jgi:hypothetical protein
MDGAFEKSLVPLEELLSTLAEIDVVESLSWSELFLLK